MSIGYVYRGWLGQDRSGVPSGYDVGLRPRLTSMYGKAAFWCFMTNWDRPGWLQTHGNGLNVLKYDGHVGFFADPLGSTQFRYTYYSGNATLISSKFDPL